MSLGETIPRPGVVRCSIDGIGKGSSGGLEDAARSCFSAIVVMAFCLDGV